MRPDVWYLFASVPLAAVDQRESVTVSIVSTVPAVSECSHFVRNDSIPMIQSRRIIEESLRSKEHPMHLLASREHLYKSICPVDRKQFER